MTGRPLLTIVVWGLVFAFVGGLVGSAIGIAAPEYYQRIFHQNDSPHFSPVRMGMGLGMIQGLVVGIGLSLILVAVQTWKETKSAVKREATSASRVLLWGVSTILTAVIFSTGGFVLGAIAGQEQLYRSLRDEKLAQIAKILESSEFPGVRPHSSSAAQVYLEGVVPDDETRTKLRLKLVQGFGVEKAESMLRNVKVAAR